MFDQTSAAASRIYPLQRERLLIGNHAFRCNATAGDSVFDDMQFQDPIRRGLKALATARGLMQALLLLLLVTASSTIAAQSLPPIMEDIRQPQQLAADLEQSDGQIVLLHFWASWCLPCREEMTALAEFWRHEYPDLAERGLRVITISNDVRDKDLARFADEFDLAFPLYYDPYSKLTSRYGVRGLPSTVVLDAEGRVLDQLLGSQNWQADDFNQRLRAFLRDERGSELDLTVKYKSRR